jgi:hypothetical protein
VSTPSGVWSAPEANADQCYVIEHGTITLAGKPSELPEGRLHDALAI